MATPNMTTNIPPPTGFLNGTHWLCLTVDKTCFDAVLEWVFSRVHRTPGATTMLDPTTQVIFIKGVPPNQLMKHSPGVRWGKNTLARPFDSVRTCATYTDEKQLPSSATCGAALRRHEQLLHHALGIILDKIQCTQTAIAELPITDAD